MAQNPDEEAINRLLKEAKVIAVVGLSADEGKPSHGVAQYLKSRGYKIIPVNPSAPEVLGEKSYPALDAVPEKIDIVNVFRRPEAVPEIAAQAIEAKARVLWLQEGIVHEEAAEKARQAGLEVIMDRCIMKEHRRLGGR